MSEKTLMVQVLEDIQQYLDRKDGELLFNERDLQMHLAVYLLGTGHYDDVDVEYYVPFKELDNYLWKNELKLDILVRKESEYLPIELKYKTKKQSKQLQRFGEQLNDAVDVLKNQGAQDLGMYDFWKDIRRLELVRNRLRLFNPAWRYLSPTTDSTSIPVARPPTTDSSVWKREVMERPNIGSCLKVHVPRLILILTSNMNTPSIGALIPTREWSFTIV